MLLCGQFMINSHFSGTSKFQCCPSKYWENPNISWMFLLADSGNHKTISGDGSDHQRVYFSLHVMGKKLVLDWKWGQLGPAHRYCQHKKKEAEFIKFQPEKRLNSSHSELSYPTDHPGWGSWGLELSRETPPPSRSGAWGVINCGTSGTSL